MIYRVSIEIEGMETTINGERSSLTAAVILVLRTIDERVAKIRRIEIERQEAA